MNLEGESETEVSAGAAERRPGLGTCLLWIALPACASVMLLAATNQICQEVAVIPFLWVLPLTLYLLTFILCFSGERWYPRWLFTALFFASSGLYALTLTRDLGFSFVAQVGVYCLLLFMCCMVCHGELVRLKPHPRHLTLFYLMVSIGGALGGILVNFVAPFVFTTGFWELQAGLLGCWVLRLIVGALNRPPALTQRLVRGIVSLALAGGGVVLGVVLVGYIQNVSSGTLLASRNFYGVLKVRDMNSDRPDWQADSLSHGATLHGFQYRASDKRRLPTAYYTENSGIGLAFLNHPRRPGPLRVGVLGLGVGTLAAYGQPGDVISFYEINPDVIRLAEGEGGYFSYLKDCPAQVRIIPGDARISLERQLEAGEAQDFDLLVLDAFSSDSIPVHLLTEEAFDLYLRLLQPDGILALHISNRYLDLRPVVWKLADHFNLGAALIDAPGDGERSRRSLWVLATHNQAFLDQPAIASRTSPPPDVPATFRLWTDEYSNMFHLLNR